MNSVTKNPLTMRTLLAIVCLFAFASTATAQIRIQIHPGKVSSFEETIKLKTISKVTSKDSRAQRAIEALDIDVFRKNQNQLVVSREQIRMRIVLAGFQENQLEVTGPHRLVVVRANPDNVRNLIESRLEELLASHFLMSRHDLKVTISPKFKGITNSDLEFSTLQLDQNFSAEIPLGSQSLNLLVSDKSGQPISLRVPVSIGVVRDLVVAKQNVSKGQTLGPEHIESVRRPVSSRNVRFASYEQVIGSQVEKDIQQYDLIKANFIRNVAPDHALGVKKNSLISVFVRRGGLTVVLKEAKALENGKPGEQIPVLNPITNERILAQVIDSATAEVR